MDIRPFLTIQEGCDKFCTFCVVPYTRGRRIFAAPLTKYIAEARSLVAAGVKEITLLGQNVNAYLGPAPKIEGGTMIGAWRNLLERIWAQSTDLERLRFTTSHPRDME